MELIIIAALMMNLAAFLLMVERNLSPESSTLHKQIAVIGCAAAFAAPAAMALGLAYVALGAFVAMSVLVYDHAETLLGWAEQAFGSARAD